MEKLTKEDLKAPDAFHTTADKVGKWAIANRNMIFAVLGVAIVAGLGKMGWDYMDSRREAAARDAIFAVEQRLREKEEELNDRELKEQAEAEEKAGANAKGKEKPEEVDEKKENPLDKVDFEKEFASLAEELLTVVRQHKGTRSALVAGSDVAALYAQFKKHDRATEVLNEILTEAREDSVIYGVLKAQLATELTFMGKTQEAIGIFQEVVEHKPSEYMHGTILLKMGLAYESLDDLERAKENYLRASTEYSDTESGRAAKNYLRLLEFKQARNPQPEKKG